MFDLHNFVFRTLDKMHLTEDEYRVRRYALGWYEKEVLTDADMETIDGWYEEAAEEAEEEASAEPEEGEGA